MKRSMLQATRRVKAKQRSERECRRRFRYVGHSLIGSEEKWWLCRFGESREMTRLRRGGRVLVSQVSEGDWRVGYHSVDRPKRRG